MTDFRPWRKWYGEIPADLVYPEVCLYEAICSVVQRVPDAIAWDFFDTTATYSNLLHSIDAFAAALAQLGLKSGERIVIALPTSPPGIIAFYAANKLGAVAAMVHPLSTAAELQHYLNATGARIAITLDIFYDHFAASQPRIPLETLVLCRISDYLPRLKGLALRLSSPWHPSKAHSDSRVRWWTKLMGQEHPAVQRSPMAVDDPAAILFSGGTTGTPKGIVLSNRNFIAEGMAAASWLDMHNIQSILAAMPIFHGFGLSLCINVPLMIGGTTVLMPKFSAHGVAKLLTKKHPNVIVGVPTLFSALINNRWLHHANLSCLHAAFCGADTLPRSIKEGFEEFVARRGGRVRLMEGYGLTETVTAIMAMPPTEYRQGSIGIPFPGMLAKICKPGTQEALNSGEVGEICVAGPALMLGYLDDPQATAQAMQKHADGRVWIHTGDFGKMDADGFFYFKERLKRIIKSSGFNVFPSEVEAVLYAHPLVHQVCVAGVPDPSQGERVAAFVVLKDQTMANQKTEREIIEYCRTQLIKWSCPRTIEFHKELPLTRLGKIDYRALVHEHISHANNHCLPQQ